MRVPILAPGRRALLLAAGGALLARPARAMPLRYEFDQAHGSIEFTVHHLGMLTSTGSFRKFHAEVVLDAVEARRASVDVTVETGSVELPFPGAEDMLRSPAYFDPAHYPTAHFKGETAGSGALQQFDLHGALTIRGVTRPFAMQGRLIGRQYVAAFGAEVAGFTAGGSLSRAAFGMTADTMMIGDTVSIGVRVKILLADSPHDD